MIRPKLSTCLLLTILLKVGCDKAEAAPEDIQRVKISSEQPKEDYSPLSWITGNDPTGPLLPGDDQNEPQPPFLDWFRGFLESLGAPGGSQNSAMFMEAVKE